MGGKGEGVSARRESHRVYPTGRVIQILAADGVEGQTFAPDAGFGAGIDTLDEAREDSGMSISRTGGQQNGVRMPIDCSDCTANRLLQMLGNPPVVFLFEVADGDDAVTGTNGEFGLRGRPTDEGGGSSNAKEDEGWLVSGRRGFPDKGVSV